MHSLVRRIAGPAQLLCRHSSRRRDGKILVALALFMPAMVAITGLVFDGGFLATEQFVQQHATDAAATAAAVDVRNGHFELLQDTATDVVHQWHGLNDVDLTANCPPVTGPFTGNAQYVEIIGVGHYHTNFFSSMGGTRDRPMMTRSVAGVGAATSGAAIIILDPLPESLSISDLPTLLQNIGQIDMRNAAVNQLNLGELVASVPLLSGIVTRLLEQEVTDSVIAAMAQTINLIAVDAVPTALPALIAGLEVEGLGRLVVDGAVHVNNTWGGLDERGERAGVGPGPPHAIACMPLLSTTRLVARDVRSVGGVDTPSCYNSFKHGGRSPLQANRLPVRDPFSNLPTPNEPQTIAASPDGPRHIVNVTLSLSAADGVVGNIVQVLPAILKPVFTTIRGQIVKNLSSSTYYPGVYDSITVIAPAGGVRFEPGIYIVRSKNPITEISICLLGPIQADGVMFYVSDLDGNYTLSGGTTSSEDDGTSPAHVTSDLVPSVVIAPLLPGGSYTGLNDANSPFHDMLIFQQPNDRRPIILEGQHLVGNSQLAGTIYAKWGHTLFVGGAGSYRMRIVSGTARFITLGDTRIEPSSLLPPATDVLLVE